MASACHPEVSDHIFHIAAVIFTAFFMNIFLYSKWDSCKNQQAS
jgi:hypothetical protein